MKKMVMIILAALVLIVVLIGGLIFLYPDKAFLLATKIERAKSGLKEKSIDVDGIHYAYLTGGKGDPLLLLHGFAGSKDHWVWIAKHLGKHFQIIAPDLPGCGSSSKDASLNYSVDEQVERVYAFSQALGLKSFHIGGNSMGGNIAGVFASRYPEITQSLWLLDPGGVDSAQPSERDILMEKGENILVAKTADDFDRTYEFAFVKPPPMPGFIKKYLAKSTAAESELVEKIYEDLANKPFPLENALSDLPIPTLILWGDQDRLTHVSGAAILESLMPNAKTIVMNNIGHMPMMENPELAAKYFIEFREIKQ